MRKLFRPKPQQAIVINVNTVTPEKLTEEVVKELRRRLTRDDVRYR